MNIPDELSPIIYSISKQVFNGELTLKEGRELLVAKGMNSNSAADYINNFRQMIKGFKYERTNKASILEYYLVNIYKDYGPQVLNSAITALDQHIKYYETKAETTMHTMRAIKTKYENILRESYDEFEENEFLLQFTKQKKSKQDLIIELNSLKSTDPEQITINSKTYKRDNKTIAMIKYVRDFKCQICSKTIKKKDGTLYVEAAHIKPKHKKGSEIPQNILLLCPNHHKEFDLGDRTIMQHNNEKIIFGLNGQVYTLSLNFK